MGGSAFITAGLSASQAQPERPSHLHSALESTIGVVGGSLALQWGLHAVFGKEPKKSWHVDDILNDSSIRYWLPSLPEVFLKECKRPYEPEEIVHAAEVCNVMADPVQDRPPKLIFQLGAAGTGKSTRMKDCYARMGTE